MTIVYELRVWSFTTTDVIFFLGFIIICSRSVESKRLRPLVTIHIPMGETHWEPGHYISYALSSACEQSFASSETIILYTWAYSRLKKSNKRYFISLQSRSDAVTKRVTLAHPWVCQHQEFVGRGRLSTRQLADFATGELFYWIHTMVYRLMQNLFASWFRYIASKKLARKINNQKPDCKRIEMSE